METIDTCKVSSLEFSPDGRHLAAVVDNVCTVYDMEVLFRV